jgi:hypothetical protein
MACYHCATISQESELPSYTPVIPDAASIQWFDLPIVWALSLCYILVFLYFLMNTGLAWSDLNEYCSSCFFFLAVSFVFSFIWFDFRLFLFVFFCFLVFVSCLGVDSFIHLNLKPNVAMFRDDLWSGTGLSIGQTIHDSFRYYWRNIFWGTC